MACLQVLVRVLSIGLYGIAIFFPLLAYVEAGNELTL